MESYFIHKERMKEDIKDITERLEHYKKVLKNLESKVMNQSYEQKEEDQMRIETLREYIKEIKKRSEARTYIYFYG